jgi:hypothetical protein
VTTLDAFYDETLTSTLQEAGFEANRLNLDIADVALEVVTTRSERSRTLFERRVDPAIRAAVGQVLRAGRPGCEVAREADGLRLRAQEIFSAVARKYGWYGEVRS